MLTYSGDERTAELAVRAMQFSPQLTRFFRVYSASNTSKERKQLMHRLLSFALFALALVAAAQAQMVVSGTPASVTSIGPGGTVSGVPASVTSLTPTQPFFSNVFDPFNSFGFGFHGKRFIGHGGAGLGFSSVVPVFVPVYSPVPVMTVPVAVDEAGRPVQTTSGDISSEGEMPAYTVFERRPRSAYDVRRAPEPRTADDYAARDRGGAPDAAAAEPAASTPPNEVAAQPPTVLVFRDGHRVEVTNYAIQGGTLFNLSDAGPRRVALTDLDVNATVKANDERGIDFAVPVK